MATEPTQPHISTKVKVALGLITIVPTLCCLGGILVNSITNTNTNIQATLPIILLSLVAGLMIIVFAHIKPQDIIEEFVRDLHKVGVPAGSAAKQKPKEPLVLPPPVPMADALPTLRGARSVANSQSPETSH